MNRKIAEVVLRKCYNELWARRNPSYTWYDVYRVDSFKAKHWFKILAQRLVDRDIDPKLYLLVLSNYGKLKDSKYLPKPVFLAGDDALKIFSWLYRKEQRKYYGIKTLMEGLTIGNEIHKEEVLESLEVQMEQFSGISNIHPPLIVLDSLKSTICCWYLALRRDYMQSAYFDNLERTEKNELRNCRAYYKGHREVFEKAMQFVAHSEYEQKRLALRKKQRRAEKQRLMVARFIESLPHRGKA